MKAASRAPSVVWFRQDLRLSDNPALHAALQTGGPVLPVFIWAPQEEGPWPPGAAARWWLHFSLQSLERTLQALGSRLIYRSGNSLEELDKLCKTSGAKAVYWSRRYEPAALQSDAKVQERLRELGIRVNTFNGHLLFEPGMVRNKSGGPYQVFSAFWRACNLPSLPSQPPLPKPRRIPAPSAWPASLHLKDLELLPKIDWAAGLRASWEPGEFGAAKKLRLFLAKALADYHQNRNRPDLPGTSQLSPHLHWGEISIRQVLDGLSRHAREHSLSEQQWLQGQFATELGWREFAYHLLYHFPQTPQQPLRPEFEKMPWRHQQDWLKAWQRGRTGYPIVDAGLRQLWATGWMHNRVRMIAASFLTKDLLLPWQEGARWFWDTLVDADLANNTLGWQWTAGCGADAAPFFRIFNPVGQGEKFDPNGDYVRAWVPELSALPADWIQKPFEAPAGVLSKAGVQLGKTYPKPLVPHGLARELALEAFAQMKRTAGGRFSRTNKLIG